MVIQTGPGTEQALRRPELKIELSRNPEDPAWDAFLNRTPGGHHVQTSLWARARIAHGWDVFRVTATRGGAVVGGAQVMTRRLPSPLPGQIGYMARGPLAAPGEQDALEAIVNAVHEGARERQVLYLITQPPACEQGERLEETLEGWGFHRSFLDSAQPVATALLDLGRDEDQLLAGMHPRTRRNIKKGIKAGVVVRQGEREDLATFHRLWGATGQRQGFQPRPLSYLEALWDSFAPAGFLELFLAEVDGEPVSGELVIAFNDSAIAKLVGWSGEHGASRPNELLKWEVIRWARRRGYRYYDVEDVDAHLGPLAAAGREIPTECLSSIDAYKLGFGGEVVSLPRPFDYAYGRLLGATVHSPAGRWLFDRPRFRKAAQRFALRAR